MKKLVLFDIDGTLLTSKTAGVSYWVKRVYRVFDEVYGVRIPFELKIEEVNGMVDRQTFWYIAERSGIARDVFLKKLGDARNVFHRELKHAVEDGHITYEHIPKAIHLVKKLKSQHDVAIGLVTGNIEINGWYKLKQAGIDSHFTFGVFSDTADNRIELVKQAIPKAQEHFQEPFVASETVIIGDTIHDITAGKAIGAHTIGVASGLSHTKDVLAKENPTLAVSSLMDQEVLDFFQIENK